MQNQHADDHYYRRSTSIWAFVLIGIGVVWLLRQSNIISAANIAVLGRLWPIILIAIGVDLLFGRQRGLSLLIGGGTLVVIIALMIIGPSVGLVQGVEVTHDTFSEPLEGAESARISLNNAVGEMTVNALNDSTDLITVDTAHVGNVQFAATGSTQRSITLRYDDEGSTNISFFPFFFSGPENDMYTRVGIAPNLPVELDVNTGVGSSTLDLTGVNVTSVNLNIGVGDTTITLPAADGAYEVNVTGGVGGGHITVLQGAAATLNITGGVGGMSVDLPDEAPIRVTTSRGLGGIDVPAWLDFVREEGDNRLYETSAYASAAEGERIEVTITGGIGGIDLR
ncbi:MAG: DUF5668 domain-containing protein [Anaerolineae bacterium]